MKYYIIVKARGHKQQLPEPYKTRAAAERYIEQALKKYPIPRSCFSIEEVEDTIDDIVKDGIALMRRHGMDPKAYGIL